MRVGIDLDGVCYDFAASVREHIIRSAGRDPGRLGRHYPDPTRWEFYEDWDLTLPEFLDVCHEGVRAGVIFTHGAPFEGVPEAFDRIRAAGHTIHIVTDRRFGGPGLAEAATLRWLDAHALPFDTITFAADKTIARLDVMVDDKPANYHALNAAGVATYLLTRPWNAHVEDAHRVRDLLHYAEVIA
ncbi:hypothetical protein DNL40_02415 [Xylanimonas oleitrophica]|uniref:Uncharacterized protein n=1 Tax=Xylanimonas oleitrophica TaxID=2607479 RepID=A0A2W5Y9D4_9MICO|nr:hypothetical protein [Xylanimonas oleitrophica]PZR55244.1 hypothetical protein DNL40_02415 [Xylanimonas oleitrophica]